MFLSAYIAKEGLLTVLLNELDDPEALVKENLVLSKKPFKKLFFMQNGWIDPIVISIQSIQDGIQKLKNLAPFFAFYPIGNFRRGQLIQEGLRKIKKAPIPFKAPLPKHPMGGFTLLDANTLFAARTTTSIYPHGVIEFEETKIPPSRAYLKLIEAFHLIQKFPQKDEKCLEIGASPGSWTYILAQFGAHIIACDRAPLDEKIARSPHIDFIQGDAFKLTPDKIGPIDWLFSDVICYPEKLYDYLMIWMNAKACKNFICTIKFQGEIDLTIPKKLLEIEKAQVIHLYHNKHELTFIKIDDSESKFDS